MKNFFSILLAFLLAVLLPFGTSAEAQGWYVVRAKEHKQPRLDPAQRCIEEHGGIYLDPAHGDENTERVIYLTFDAGYENGNVAKILDILKQEEVTAAFFILGHLIKSAPEVVRRMREEGHLVCNHTTRHKDVSRLSDEEFCAEIKTLEAMYQELTGQPLAKYFRPPEGRFDTRTLTRAEAQGYRTVFWSLTYADWDADRAPSPERALALMKDNTHNGAIVLLHPTADINVKILKDIITYWKAEGYRFGSLTEI